MTEENDTRDRSNQLTSDHQHCTMCTYCMRSRSEFKVVVFFCIYVCVCSEKG